MMSELLERKLSPRERIELRLHLYVCTWCSHYLKQIRLLRALARENQSSLAESYSKGLSEQARTRISKLLSKD